MELSVEQAQVSIKVVKIGNKSMTKAVFRQIPNISKFSENDIVFGYIRDDSDAAYLVNREGTLLKFKMDYAPRELGSFEEERKGCVLSKEEYDKRVAHYDAYYNKVKDAEKLYMAI